MSKNQKVNFKLVIHWNFMSAQNVIAISSGGEFKKWVENEMKYFGNSIDILTN